MQVETTDHLLLKIEQLESRLAESEQLIDAIKAGEVDAFALNTNKTPEVYTLQSGDYAYRVLIEEIGEGAVNLSEDGLIVYTNSCFAEILGLPYEKVIGHFISEFIEPPFLEEFTNLFRGVFKGKKQRRNEFAGWWKNDFCLRFPYFPAAQTPYRGHDHHRPHGKEKT